MPGARSEKDVDVKNPEHARLMNIPAFFLEDPDFFELDLKRDTS